jgi:hypothetical protein
MMLLEVNNKRLIVSQDKAISTDEVLAHLTCWWDCTQVYTLSSKKP